jgi:adenylyl- and sulfurtransferase ThiI
MLTDLLVEKRTSLINSWLKLIFGSYPPETAEFLKKEKDRFSNPLAYQIIRGVNGLFEALIQETEEEKLFANLDEVIKVQAIQQFSASQALAFIFLLKKVIREHLAEELQDENLAQECLEIESKIDGLALLGFDVYMKRREKLYEIRMLEVKASVGGLIRKTGLSLEITEVPTCK